jgi:hypothetical protein
MKVRVFLDVLMPISFWVNPINEDYISWVLYCVLFFLVSLGVIYYKVMFYYSSFFTKWGINGSRQTCLHIYSIFLHYFPQGGECLGGWWEAVSNKKSYYMHRLYLLFWAEAYWWQHYGRPGLEHERQQLKDMFRKVESEVTLFKKTLADYESQLKDLPVLADSFTYRVLQTALTLGREWVSNYESLVKSYTSILTHPCFENPLTDELEYEVKDILVFFQGLSHYHQRFFQCYLQLKAFFLRAKLELWFNRYAVVVAQKKTTNP